MFLSIHFGCLLGSEPLAIRAGWGGGKDSAFSGLLCPSGLVPRQVIGDLRSSQLRHLYSQPQPCLTDRPHSEARP